MMTWRYRKIEYILPHIPARYQAHANGAKTPKCIWQRLIINRAHPLLSKKNRLNIQNFEEEDDEIPADILRNPLAHMYGRIDFGPSVV